MKIRKSIMSLVLTLCLAAGFVAVPVSAHAAGNDRAIQPGTSGVAAGNYLYFGTSGTQWRVLDADSTNTGAAGMFLLSEGVLATKVYFKEDGSSSSWQGSDAQEWCKNNFGSIFTPAEQNAVLTVSKTDPEADLYSLLWGASSLNKEYLFFLSAQEAATYLGANDRDPGLVSSSDWWLRSPIAYYDTYAGFVNPKGIVSSEGVYFSFGARPAFNLNLNTVLFTSPASGGKDASGLQEIGSYDGSEWKVTILDSSRDGFSAKMTANNSGVLTVEYSGAVSGGNNYISAMIADGSGANTHYGRLATASASGSVTVDLSGIDMSGKTLYIFNEQCNGDKMTDLSSRLVKVDLTVANPYGVPSTGSHRDTGLMLTLALVSGAVLVFSLRRRKEA